MSRFVCLFSIVLCTAATAAAQPPTPSHSIAGIVLDAQDRVVPGAEVRLDLNGVVRRQNTDATGRFTFDRVAGGHVVMTVIAAGFEPLQRIVDARDGSDLRFQLSLARVEDTLHITAAHRGLAADVDEQYARNKSLTSIQGGDLANYSPVAKYAALRLLPGVMNSGAGGRDRFSLPTHIRGGHAWGTVETIDQYPAVNITPVSAEDGGYTAGLSSIIPSVAVQSITLATGGLGVSYGQASGGVVRNYLKSGSSTRSSASMRFEALSLGEGLVMGDAGGGIAAVDYYLAAQGSMADYGRAYNTFARPIEGLRLGSVLAKVGVQTSPRGRWETLYVGGRERHDYYQEEGPAAQRVRHNYHTDKDNQFLASRYDWRRSETMVVGIGLTQSWFRENRLEEAVGASAIDVSRRNRPQRATRAFANVAWRTPLGPALQYTGTAGTEITWDRFEDVTTQPIGFSFAERAAFWRSSVALADAVTFNGGLRVVTLDNAFRTTTRALYDAGAAWTLPLARTRLFGSWSTGYKLNKPFYLWWGNGQFIGRAPAVGLRPSTTETIEVGVEQPVVSNFATGTVRVALYRAREADLFNFANTTSGLPFYDAARTRGAEVWTEWQRGRWRPFASFTWLRSYRDATTAPNASTVDLRFAPLPNYAAGFGTHVDLHRTIAASVFGIYDDGGVSEQSVNDSVAVTRFGGFTKVSAALTWTASPRWTVFSRLENVLNRRNMGFDRTIIDPDGSARRVAGTQRDPGVVVSLGINVELAR